MFLLLENSFLIWVKWGCHLRAPIPMFISLLLVWPVPLAQVLPHPQLIFPSKTWFFGNLLEFSAAEISLKSNISHILNPNLTK